ncbi:thiol-disulfide oxidoreductase DCC family protein [Bacillus aquiflavi]|uniref:Thiol-disulfide oxidoreductase DCC family protein n=1 Tax=Bacillus aquiflavi TaxID=2672567 RepID=A0A6B3W4E1_9BACI|nr:thiol-disulfide oxidoreductase DCC family protein [Bacillus aquiflavi]NEY82334.1 thiol-disulfide oxidoreductase DCC family protein [Bacillus aquiflavi]UAC47763.1 thiol-disulfide oxidoreductase DCC family protein [Bacillus aquiflavi]
MTALILYDGVCNFCNRSVQFIIKRDPNAYYQFASLQGETAQKLLSDFRVKGDVDSFILIEDGQLYVKSTAALRICKQLAGTVRFLTFFLVVPRPIRDFFYDIIAKNRYKWFGESDHCLIPSDDIKKRFVD